jgi:hypothetical protein
MHCALFRGVEIESDVLFEKRGRASARRVLGPACSSKGLDWRGEQSMLVAVAPTCAAVAHREGTQSHGGAHAAAARAQSGSATRR